MTHAMPHQEEQIRDLAAATGPYPPAAFDFVREGLSYTSMHIHGDPEALPERERHVSPQQLCIGLRDFAVDRYGMLAPAVLEHWNIRRTDDFGRIVFALIEAQLMSKTDDDRMEDFRAVYDFDESFGKEELRGSLFRN